MADRFYTNTTNLVIFAAGERPTADKFNAVNRYFSRGLESLAKVIGDAYDSGVPHGLGETQSVYLTNRWNKSSTKNRPLDIVNLARLIGPASNLNPRYLNRGLPSVIDEVIPEGILEYYTNFPLGSINTNLSAAYPGFEFDLLRSMIRFPEETLAAIDLKYTVKGGDEIEGGPNYIDAEFNVIPDPNTPETEADYNLSINENIEGDYIITLPTTGYQQSKLLNRFDSNIDVSDPNNNLSLQLPFWMDNFINGQLIPSGCLYLKDRTTGESFVDAMYTYISETEVKVSNVELCLTEDHVFCLVTAGTDITTSIDDMRTKLFMHKHDGSFGESRISIYDLKDVFKYAPPSGAYKKSELAWNAVPQYLHRDGWQEGEDSFNGENGMRGPLMMGLADFSSGIAGTNGTSNKILFGGTNTFMQRVTDSLLVSNVNSGINIDSQSLITTNNFYNNLSETTFTIASNTNGVITTANTLDINFKTKSLNGDLKYFDERVFVISEDGFNTPINEFDHLNVKEENIGVKEKVYKPCSFQFVTPAEYDLFDANQYGAFSPTPSTISGTNINQIVLVDGLHHFYDTSGGGGVLQEFATGLAQNQNTDSSNLIPNYTSTSDNTEVTEFLLDEYSGSNYSISIKSAILPAKFNIRTWKSFVGNPPQAPNAGYGDNTLVIYDLAFKKPGGVSVSEPGAYRSSTWEIDRGYAWKSNVFNNTRFDIESEYKNTFYIDFSPFPYWKWGLEDQDLPVQKIILDYRLSSIDLPLSNIKISFKNNIDDNFNIEKIVKGIINGEQKVELTLDNTGFNTPEDMSGLIGLRIEECFIDGQLFLVIDPVLFANDFYYKKFI